MVNGIPLKIDRSSFSNINPLIQHWSNKMVFYLTDTPEPIKNMGSSYTHVSIHSLQRFGIATRLRLFGGIRDLATHRKISIFVKACEGHKKIWHFRVKDWVFILWRSEYCKVKRNWKLVNPVRHWRFVELTWFLENRLSFSI